MITRYSLYGDAIQWSGNVQEDIEGRWLKWKDTEAYVQYALKHGYTPPVEVDPIPQVRQDMVEPGVLSVQTEMFDEDNINGRLDDGEDVFDMMTKLTSELDDEV